MKLATCLLIGLGSLCAWAAEASPLPVQQLGMVTDGSGIVYVFDTDPASVIGAVHIAGSGAGTGDCVISPDGRRGFVTDAQRHLWVIDLTSIPPQLAPGANPIPLSGPGNDVASTADGRFLVVCDDGFGNLVSVVDVAARVESSTFDLGVRCSAVDVCSNGSVLVASDATQSVRRLVIDAAGHLSDTGERLLSVDAANVHCSPSGAAGVALGINGHLRSFRVTGMVQVSDRGLSAYGASGAMAKDGTRFYGRSFDDLEAFDFDQATAELGMAPAFSVSTDNLGFYNFEGTDQLALDYAGTTLYTPARFHLTVNDAVTGAALPGLFMPDLLFSGGICFGPQNQSGCHVADCDDGNPCTDDVCGDTGCLHVADDSNPCGVAEDCSFARACSAGACISMGPANCNATCPPGFNDSGSPIFGGCQKTYDIDASLLDNLAEFCDGSGTNRYSCNAGSYGFHWLDEAGTGVGPVVGIDLWLVAGRDCEEGQSSVSFNGVPSTTIGSAVDCSCSPVHTPIRLFPDPAVYVKGGLNAISIVPTGTCEGLSASPQLDGSFARVIVAYAPLDPNCSEGVCNPASHRCDYTVQNCDDGNPCTDDTCDAQGACVYVPVPEYTDCSDGNICNGHEYCHEGGDCYSDYPSICYDDGNPCTAEHCDPVIGCVSEVIDCDDHNPCTDDSCDYAIGCLHVNNSGACDDGDLCTRGETCRDGSCTPAFSGLIEPNPRTNGYYKRLCQGPHFGDQLTDADAVCVASVAHTFALISTVGELCAELQPSQPNNDPCDRAEDDLMVLALNICRARLCVAQSIDSQCGANANVGQSLAQSDDILGSASRNGSTCATAKCLDEEINTGRALELNTLSVRREGSGIRLTWAPPYLDDGTGQPSQYNVWRRPLGTGVPFAKIGVTTEATFLDDPSEGDAFEYEVTAVME